MSVDRPRSSSETERVPLDELDLLLLAGSGNAEAKADAKAEAKKEPTKEEVAARERELNAFPFGHIKKLIDAGFEDIKSSDTKSSDDKSLGDDADDSKSISDKADAKAEPKVKPKAIQKKSTSNLVLENKTNRAYLERLGRQAAYRRDTKFLAYLCEIKIINAENFNQFYLNKTVGLFLLNLITPIQFELNRALCTAVFSGHDDVVQAFLSKGAQFASPLHRLSYEGNHDEFKKQYKKEGRPKDQLGADALHYAAAGGHLAILTDPIVLYEHGTLLFQKDSNGNDCVMWAIAAGKQETVTALNNNINFLEYQDKHIFGGIVNNLQMGEFDLLWPQCVNDRGESAHYHAFKHRHFVPALRYDTRLFPVVFKYLGDYVNDSGAPTYKMTGYEVVAQYGHYHYLKKCVPFRKNHNVSSYSPAQATAFINAASVGNRYLMEVLWGESPILMYSHREGISATNKNEHIETFDYEGNREKYFEETALNRAICDGQLHVVKWLLSLTTPALDMEGVNKGLTAAINKIKELIKLTKEDSCRNLEVDTYYLIVKELLDHGASLEEGVVLNATHPIFAYILLFDVKGKQSSKVIWGKDFHQHLRFQVELLKRAENGGHEELQRLVPLLLSQLTVIPDDESKKKVIDLLNEIRLFLEEEASKSELSPSIYSTLAEIYLNFYIPSAIFPDDEERRLALKSDKNTKQKFELDKAIERGAKFAEKSKKADLIAAFNMLQGKDGRFAPLASVADDKAEAKIKSSPKLNKKTEARDHAELPKTQANGKTSSSPASDSKVQVEYKSLDDEEAEENDNEQHKSKVLNNNAQQQSNAVEELKALREKIETTEWTVIWFPCLFGNSKIEIKDPISGQVHHKRVPRHVAKQHHQILSALVYETCSAQIARDEIWRIGKEQAGRKEVAGRVCDTQAYYESFLAEDKSSEKSVVRKL